MGSNVKGGNENQPGSLQQCRSVHGPTFSGQYCKVSLKQVKTTTEKLQNADRQVLTGFWYLCRERWSTLRASAFPTLAQRKRCRRWCCTVSDSRAQVGPVLSSHSPPFAFLPAKLQIGQTSLIPPLPPILVNESTQELVSIRCLSNILAPDASAITCLSVNGDYFLSVLLKKCFTVKYVSSFRFVCCVMVAIPLAATFFTAIIRWQRNKELRPSAESSCLGSLLNLYGTMRTTGSPSREPASFTMKENSEG